jgi:hypothetical protein
MLAIPWGDASKQFDQTLRVILFFLQRLTEASFLRCFGKTKNPSCEGFDQIASAEKEGFEPLSYYTDNDLFTSSLNSYSPFSSPVIILQRTIHNKDIK